MFGLNFCLGEECMNLARVAQYMLSTYIATIVKLNITWTATEELGVDINYIYLVHR